MGKQPNARELPITDYSPLTILFNFSKSYDIMQKYTYFDE